MRDKDLTAPEDVEKVNRGKIAEWEKLIKHRAIRLVEGPEATKIRNGPDAKTHHGFPLCKDKRGGS